MKRELINAGLTVLLMIVFPASGGAIGLVAVGGLLRLAEFLARQTFGVEPTVGLLGISALIGAVVGFAGMNAMIEEKRQ